MICIKKIFLKNACCGKHLENTGAERVFTENEVYGPEVVTSVMNGKNYIMGSRGMALFSETLHRLLLGYFISHEIKGSGTDNLLSNARKFNDLLQEDHATMNEQLITDWEIYRDLVEEFSIEFSIFQEKARDQSKQFQLWETFLKGIYPPLRDLKRSFREGNWELHLSAVRRSIPLVFAFDRTNYKRWLPVYYEDCLSMEEKFPMMYENFKDGGFVVRMSKRRGSAVPMDQALEKAFNKPSKGQSGIIGMSRRKEAVCKWSLIKHEKMRYTSTLVEYTGINDDNEEYSLHHEFSQKTSEHDNECVEQMNSYVLRKGNPFNPDDVSIKNLVTKAQFDDETCTFLLSCIDEGEVRYKEFIRTRFEEKTKKIFDTIPKTRVTKTKRKKDERRNTRY